MDASFVCIEASHLFLSGCVCRLSILAAATYLCTKFAGQLRELRDARALRYLKLDNVTPAFLANNSTQSTKSSLDRTRENDHFRLKRNGEVDKGCATCADLTVCAADQGYYAAF
jgi:hypothetical protein